MVSMLLLGLLIGMQHAMEADHMAALSSLATRERSVGQTVKLGAVWGMGHALTLLLFGGIVLVMDRAMPERLAQGLEFAVGSRLVLLEPGRARQRGEAIGARSARYEQPGAQPLPQPSRENCGHCPYRKPCIAINDGSVPGPILKSWYRKRGDEEVEQGRLGGSRGR